METKEFDNPQEGYDFLNRWTDFSECYQIRFAGKDVLKVSVLMKEGKPVSATVHYQKDNVVGFDPINLEGRLRDEPISKKDFEFMEKLSKSRK